MRFGLLSLRKYTWWKVNNYCYRIKMYSDVDYFHYSYRGALRIVGNASIIIYRSPHSFHLLRICRFCSVDQHFSICQKGSGGTEWLPKTWWGSEYGRFISYVFKSDIKCIQYTWCSAEACYSQHLRRFCPVVIDAPLAMIRPLSQSPMLCCSKGIVQ